jgi:hypothetical protein
VPEPSSSTSSASQPGRSSRSSKTAIVAAIRGTDQRPVLRARIRAYVCVSVVRAIAPVRALS